MCTVVRAVHDRLVGPLKIEGIDQRLAHAAILELVAPRVHEPALRAGRRGVRDHAALDAAILHRRKIVARRPDPRRELLTEQVVLGGEAFEPDLAVAVVFVANGVEVALADRYWKVGAPPVLDP